MWLGSGLLLGQKVSLCTAVGRAGGVTGPTASMDAGYKVQTEFMKAQELEKTLLWLNSHGGLGLSGVFYLNSSL